MNVVLIHSFISGAVAMGCLAIALFFLNFWRRHRLGLFGCFALAFSLLAIERVVTLLGESLNERGPAVYLIRLAAFAVIIAGIVAQNRRKSP
jgi:hypothetical protein